MTLAVLGTPPMTIFWRIFMLISIEGIDGSGKTTLYNNLKIALSDLNPIFTREPGSPYMGAAVRRAIAESTDPFVEATLFVADHAVHVATLIRPALEAGKLVITDRYIDSRFAYQRVSLERVHPNPQQWLEETHRGWTIIPDITFFLSLPNIETAMGRMEHRGNSEHFEKYEILKKVYSNYMDIVADDKTDRFVFLDATDSPENLANKAAKIIRAAVSEQKTPSDVTL